MRAASQSGLGKGRMSEWQPELVLQDPESRRALDQAHRLGPSVREELWASAAPFAKTSPRLAGAVIRTGLRLWESCGPDGFARWAQALRAAIAEPALPREVCEELIAVTPAVLNRIGNEDLLGLVAEARALAQHGRRLAALWLGSAIPLVGKVPVETLCAAGRLARQLAEQKEPHAEFAALAFVETLPVALSRLDAEGLELWARCGSWFFGGEPGREFFHAPAPAWWRLRPPERTAVLRGVWACREARKDAWRLFSTLPEGVGCLPARERQQLLDLCARSAWAHPAGWAEAAPAAGALLRALPARSRTRALALLGQVTDAFPRAVPVLLRRLHYLVERADWQRIAEWAAYGLELARHHPSAAEAFFACESRTSERVLLASSTAAQLADVQGWLRKYIHMLSGMPVSLRSTGRARLLAALEEQPLEGEVELPERIDWFLTFEDNVRAYRWLAVQLAGRREHGTYAGEENGTLPWMRAIEESEPRLQLEEWFTLTESYRVARAMARVYPAWRAEERQFARDLLRRWEEAAPARRPSWFDWLLAWLLAGAERTAVADSLAPAALIVEEAVRPLARADADVHRSLQVAQALAQAFAAVAEVAREVEASDETAPPYLIAADLLEGDEALPFSDGTSAEATVAASESFDNEGKQWKVDEAAEATGGQPLSADALRALLESGTELRFQQGRADSVEALGLYISDLLDKLPLDQRETVRRWMSEESRNTSARRFLESRSRGSEFYYDEWDYQIQDYRRAWCRLVELPVEGDSGEFFLRTLEEYSDVLPQVRREFQKVRPDQYRFVRGLESGDEVDLNAVVEARSDLRARRTPTDKLYVARQREERDVATLFLLDMSASTDEPADPRGGSGFARNGRRIIDIAKEALVLMAAALEEIGDAYAIYGFSGHGRHNVEFYLVKSFREGLSSAVRGRIGALEPKRSTRMGAALRHAAEKMASVPARCRHLILISDGFPQDFDYGQDRRSNVYGLRDTTVALQECEAAGILPFCITVDRAGHDYLREMCPSSRYLVIEDIGALPRELPKIYQQVVGF